MMNPQLLTHVGELIRADGFGVETVFILCVAYGIVRNKAATTRLTVKRLEALVKHNANFIQQWMTNTILPVTTKVDPG